MIEEKTPPLANCNLGQYVGRLSVLGSIHIVHQSCLPRAVEVCQVKKDSVSRAPSRPWITFAQVSMRSEFTACLVVV